MLRTTHMRTEEQQEQFYYDIVNDRNANSHYWGIYMTTGMVSVDYSGLSDVVSLIGMAGIENIQWINSLGEISLILAPGKWDYLNPALSSLLHKGFMDMNLENLYAEIYTSNSKCASWILQGGKHKASVSRLPNRKYYNGEYHDSMYINFNKKGFQS